MKNYRRGWFNESQRHSLAARGIKTSRHKRFLVPLGSGFFIGKETEPQARNTAREWGIHEDKVVKNLSATGLKKYYSTSMPMTMRQFIDTEVKERNNYPLSEVEGWMKKYNLNLDSKVLWVAAKPWIAWRYNEMADTWDDIPYLKKQAKKNIVDIDVCEAEDKDIIFESDDSDEGYLMIVAKGKVPVLPDQAGFFGSLWEKNKGVFYRGTADGKGVGFGALGNGTYYTWKKCMAQAFADYSKEQHGGKAVVKKVKLPRDIKLLDAQSKTMFDIKKELGVSPFAKIDNPLFARILTQKIKDKGFDGVISDDVADGIVVFN